MKKMSAVFELPVKGFELEYLMSETTGDDDDLIAHAINHVDALYDALQALFDDYKALTDSGDAGYWKLEETDVGAAALKALTGYKKQE